MLKIKKLCQIISSAFLALFVMFVPLSAQADTYTVSYNANAPAGVTVTGSTQSSSHTYDVEKNLTTNKYTAPGYVFMGWSTDKFATTPDYTNGQSVTNLATTSGGTVNLYAVWTPAKFTITTTSTNPSMFRFKMSAAGTFYVDCGNGGILSGTGVSGNTITRTDTTETSYACKWDDYIYYSTQTIKFAGEATNYNTNTFIPTIRFFLESMTSMSDDNAPEIASVSGSLSALFPYISGNQPNGAQPRFVNTFWKATNLTSVPATLFKDYTTGADAMFQGTFGGCTSLTTIPSDLFSNITTGASSMFTRTFRDCTSLTTIPADLFSSITTGAAGMFNSTFYGCTSLTTIPSDLFSSITTGAESMFAYTFQGCTSLATIPSDLFSSITTGADSLFGYTFSGCTSLDTIPSDLFSSITTGAESMFEGTFSGCKSLTTIPSDLFSNITAEASYRFMFRETFYGCTSLDTIPSNLFSSITTGAASMFEGTFSGCTSLDTIPSDLFSSITTGASAMFRSTFSGCKSLTTIPADLFSGISSNGIGYMFYGTFSGCTSLEKIPSGLFSNITTGADDMFYGTFSGCTSLTTIPADLFSGISGIRVGYMFRNTFSGCTSLANIGNGSTSTSYVPRTFFNSVITGTNNVMDMFYNTVLADQCPAGTHTDTPSGFSNAGKPLCTPCAEGYYTSTARQSSCTACADGTYNIGTGNTGCIANTVYTVTFDKKGGTGGTDYLYFSETGTNVYTNSSLTDVWTSADGIGVPTRTGYAFNGYYFTGTSCGNTKNNYQVFDSNGAAVDPEDIYVGQMICDTNITLDADWTPITYTVVYNKNAPADVTVSGTTQSSSHTYGVAQNLTTNGYSAPKYLFMGWSTSSSATTPDYTDGQSVTNLATTSGETVNLYAVWTPAKFTITTTSTNSFQFKMSAAGTFYVDCGTGGTLSGTGVSGNTITRTDTTEATYTCGDWGNSATRTIRFGGEATNYNTGTNVAAIRFNINGTDSDTNASKIASVSGSLSELFPYLSSNGQTGAQPRFVNTFWKATNLTSVPATLFKDYTTGVSNMFAGTFKGCTSLATIPSGLFKVQSTSQYYNESGIFNETFKGCTLLKEIPSGLFAGVNGAASAFNSTFKGCTSLTTIPDNLFVGVNYAGEATFYETFSGCTALTTVPWLFGYMGVNSGAEGTFVGTFSGCTNLANIKHNSDITSYVPRTFFNSAIDSVSNIVIGTFSGTQLASTCPAGTHTDTPTAFSDAGKPFCTPCANGYYTSTAGQSSCTACADGTYNTGTGNTSCSGNDITITWRGVETVPSGSGFSEVSNNVATSNVSHGGDIITPVKAIEVAKMRFVGWGFVK